jgi:hypothetical protein
MNLWPTIQLARVAKGEQLGIFHCNDRSCSVAFGPFAMPGHFLSRRTRDSQSTNSG